MQKTCAPRQIMPLEHATHSQRSGYCHDVDIAIAIAITITIVVRHRFHAN